jgi:hypothetical protein
MMPSDSDKYFSYSMPRPRIFGIPPEAGIDFDMTNAIVSFFSRRI